MSKKIYPLID